MTDDEQNPCNETVLIPQACTGKRKVVSTYVIVIALRWSTPGSLFQLGTSVRTLQKNIHNQGTNLVCEHACMYPSNTLFVLTRVILRIHNIVLVDTIRTHWGKERRRLALLCTLSHLKHDMSIN